MAAIKIILGVFSVLVIVQTVFSFLKTRAWWVRIFDFPRAQIAAASVLLLALFGAANFGLERAGTWEWILFVLLAASVIVQARQMLPYTHVWRPDVQSVSGPVDPKRRLRLVISNVRMENRDFARWRETVLRAKPDVVVAVETDRRWDEELRSLETDFPHSVRRPQDNTYGMIVCSRLPLSRTKIKFLVERNVPSVFTVVELPDGGHVRLVVLHPRPPRPDIRQDSDLRDAELVKAAEVVRRFGSPLIVAGDLNDVAWSHTSRLFLRLAGLLDPRVGRGRFSTYHADHRFLRYPLDHVFVSPQFELVQIRRLEHVGSDHFPILLEVALRGESSDSAEPEALSEDDEDDAIDAVQDARERKENESARERRERQAADS